MHKKALIYLAALLFIFAASTFVWQSFSSTFNSQNASETDHNNADLALNKVDLNEQEASKTVDLDQYIASNQVSQNIIDKKQRVILEPELITFHGVLQAPITSSKAKLVTDTLAVWGISPLPEVAFNTYIRSPAGQVIAVYVENLIANHITTNYPVASALEFQAYRLYNYAKGPRLLLVDAKPSNGAASTAVNTTVTSSKSAKNSAKADANPND